MGESNSRCKGREKEAADYDAGRHYFELMRMARNEGKLDAGFMLMNERESRLLFRTHAQIKKVWLDSRELS